MYSNDIFKSSDLFSYSNFEQQNETTCSTCYTKINLTNYNDQKEISHKRFISEVVYFCYKIILHD